MEGVVIKMFPLCVRKQWKDQKRYGCEVRDLFAAWFIQVLTFSKWGKWSVQLSSIVLKKLLGIATRSKKPLGAPGLTTRNKDATRSRLVSSQLEKACLEYAGSKILSGVLDLAKRGSVGAWA